MKINESAQKNEKLFLEYYELKVDNTIFHSKLKESRKAENVITDMHCSLSTAAPLCCIQGTSNHSIPTQSTCPIVIEDILDNEIAQNLKVEQ